MATRALDTAPPRVETRSRRYDPAETRQRVLAAANMLFSTRGFAATGTADIAREADVSEGSIFYHFGSKQNLLGELGKRYGEAMIAAMQQGDRLEDLEPGIIIPARLRVLPQQQHVGIDHRVGVRGRRSRHAQEPGRRAVLPGVEGNHQARGSSGR